VSFRMKALEGFEGHGAFRLILILHGPHFPRWPSCELTGGEIGLVGAMWLGQAGSSLLFGVSATDPVTFIAVPLMLTAVAAAACVVPARRAMGVSPIEALRQRVL
jgi:hypothetical protein